MIFILNDELDRQNEFVLTLQQFTKPDSLSQGQQLYLSEDEILKKYIDNVNKKYIQFIKHSEKAMGYKYSLKEIVKRITIEGEHTYLLLLNMGGKANSVNK